MLLTVVQFCRVEPSRGGVECCVLCLPQGPPTGSDRTMGMHRVQAADAAVVPGIQSLMYLLRCSEETWREPTSSLAQAPTCTYCSGPHKTAEQCPHCAVL